MHRTVLRFGFTPTCLETCLEGLGFLKLIILYYPANMSDPVWKCFGYSQLWPFHPACSQNQAGSVQPELGQVIYAAYNFLYPIQFCSSKVAKKAQIILCKTIPDPIWTAWSAFGLTYLIKKQVSVQESCGQILDECNQPPTSFPHSDLNVFFLR